MSGDDRGDVCWSDLCTLFSCRSARDCYGMHLYVRLHREREYTRFEHTLENAIEDVLYGFAMSEDRVQFLNATYEWNWRKTEWENLLTSLV